MKETLQKIRDLLDELESMPSSAEPAFKESFQLFELPELVTSIVDYLQPGASAIRSSDILAYVPPQYHRYR